MRKHTQICADRTNQYPLQWGRNFIVAETIYVISRIFALITASMGPQLYRCGNLSVAVWLAAGTALQWGRNFIVAETWKAPIIGVYGSLMLQWGRNFIVAETRQPWRLLGQTEGSFNGAATLSLRKRQVRIGNYNNYKLQWGRNFIVAETGDEEEEKPTHCIASMGPQLYRCGNCPKSRWTSWTSRGFNGAATLSLRKRTVRRGVHLEGRGFNGAATLSLRKPAMVAYAARVKECFNGAATLSLRKRGWPSCWPA